MLILLTLALSAHVVEAGACPCPRECLEHRRRRGTIYGLCNQYDKPVQWAVINPYCLTELCTPQQRVYFTCVAQPNEACQTIPEVGAELGYANNAVDFRLKGYPWRTVVSLHGCIAWDKHNTTSVKDCPKPMYLWENTESVSGKMHSNDVYIGPDYSVTASDPPYSVTQAGYSAFNIVVSPTFEVTLRPTSNWKDCPPKPATCEKVLRTHGRWTYGGFADAPEVIQFQEGHTSTSTESHSITDEHSLEISLSYEFEMDEGWAKDKTSIGMKTKTAHTTASTISNLETITKLESHTYTMPMAGVWWQWKHTVETACGAVDAFFPDIVTTNSVEEPPCCVAGFFKNASQPRGDCIGYRRAECPEGPDESCDPLCSQIKDKCAHDACSMCPGCVQRGCDDLCVDVPNRCTFDQCKGCEGCDSGGSSSREGSAIAHALPETTAAAPKLTLKKPSYFV